MDDSSVCSISGDEGKSAQANTGIIHESLFMAFSDCESDDEPGAFTKNEEEAEVAYMFQPTGFTPYYPGNAEQIEEMRKNAGNWRPEKEFPEKSKSCNHPWKENCVTGFNTCYYCGMLTTERSRLHCHKCELTACALCALHYLKIKVNVAKIDPVGKVTKNEERRVTEEPLMQMLKEKDEEIKKFIKEQALNEF